ncbi:lycopene cyclase domain-containing protein [Kocuria carniphila]|uniref:lycopene cyclase domain-containing protein n=1 Tax=Kocuria carniphila TaxID=262208 RepID=UPI0028E9B09D|nr:lycopene cyclase domain-containing protein [Kocuria carniphila]
MYLLMLLVFIGCYTLIDRRWKLYFWSGAPMRAWIVLIVGVLFFLAWDVVGIINGLFWHGENSLTLGIFVAPELPLEEVFFLAFLCYQTMIYILGAPVLWRWLRSRAGTSRGSSADGALGQRRRSGASAADGTSSGGGPRALKGDRP